MLNMEKITWQAVVVIIAALGAVITLVWLGQDLTAVGVLIAGLFGWTAVQQATTKEQVNKVESNTNGNNKILVDALLEDRKHDRAILRQVLLALPPGTQLHDPRLIDDDTKVLEGDTLEQ